MTAPIFILVPPVVNAECEHGAGGVKRAIGAMSQAFVAAARRDAYPMTQHEQGRAAMVLKSFKVDDEIVKTLELLKKRFNVRTDAGVIERALGLARVATEVAGDEGVVTLDGTGGKQSIALNR